MHLEELATGEDRVVQVRRDHEQRGEYIHRFLPVSVLGAVVD
jgi:hypothetical protein